MPRICQRLPALPLRLKSETEKSVIFPQHKADIFLFHCFSDGPLGVPVLRGGQDPNSNSSPKILSLVLNYHFCFTVPSSFLAPRDFTKSFFFYSLPGICICVQQESI